MTPQPETRVPKEPIILDSMHIARVRLAGSIARIVHHPLSSFTRRAFYAIVVLAVVIVVDIVGLMLLQGWGLIASHYFMASLATAEDLAATPAMDAGKIFAGVMAFFSIGAAESTITFTFVPLFGSALKEGLRFVEKEEEKLKEKLERKDPTARQPSE